MADFLGLMKQAAELKSKMETMQAQLDQIEVEGTSGGGLVSVKLSGKGEMKSVKIDDTLIKPRRRRSWRISSLPPTLMRGARPRRCCRKK
jgi:DNA-binding protein, YbaB/EbfC family